MKKLRINLYQSPNTLKNIQDNKKFLKDHKFIPTIGINNMTTKLQSLKENIFIFPDFYLGERSVDNMEEAILPTIENKIVLIIPSEKSINIYNTAETEKDKQIKHITKTKIYPLQNEPNQDQDTSKNDDNGVTRQEQEDKIIKIDNMNFLVLTHMEFLLKDYLSVKDDDNDSSPEISGIIVVAYAYGTRSFYNRAKSILKKHKKTKLDLIMFVNTDVYVPPAFYCVGEYMPTLYLEKFKFETYYEKKEDDNDLYTLKEDYKTNNNDVYSVDGTVYEFCKEEHYVHGESGIAYWKNGELKTENIKLLGESPNPTNRETYKILTFDYNPTNREVNNINKNNDEKVSP
ncbi:MAG: hypothetical protein GY754_20810 [bacterium]|nr:hypothetical protein [bacterium]